MARSSKKKKKGGRPSEAPAPVAAEPGLERPSDWEAYRYVRNFIATLLGTFAVVSLTLLGYNLYTRSVAVEVEPLLADGTDGAALKQAFERLETPHLFSGWRVPDEILSPDDPDLAGLDEEALVKAALALEPAPRSVPSGPSVSQCKGVVACVIGALGRTPGQRVKRVPQRYKVFRYLMARRAMARGTVLSESELKFFRWNRTLWVRAFRRQVMDGEGIPTESDRVLLRDLHESLQGGSSNGLVLAWYGLAASVVFGATLLVWVRRRRPQGAEPVESAPG